MIDTKRLIATIGAHRDYFVGRGDIIVARAPGRLDVMGGIADYSGSLVLELPLEAATIAAAQRVDEATVTVRSVTERATLSVSLEKLAGASYDDARSALASEPRNRWLAYVAGAFVVLARERGVSFPHGVRILIDSTVPAGKGVASSAALEVSAMRAICAVYDIELDARSLALLCQTVENRVVGAPCGVMDQMTAACGEENRLLALLCQPAEVAGQVPLPPGVELWGIDSGIRHEVGGSDYGAVRTGAFMGLAILETLVGRRSADWRGYLANVAPSLWVELRDQIPLEMSGSEFLGRFGDIRDSVTRVDAARTYAIRQPTEHPIFEHARVQEFKRILESGASRVAERRRLGALMFESHASYSACALGSSGTDRLVELVRSAPSSKGLYGAKITGGGSGGVVAVLARKGSRAAIDDIANRYASETGLNPAVLGGSSPGAGSFGIVRLHGMTDSG